LIKNADLAMYTAKCNGKNQFVFCSEKMEEDMQRTMIITQNLYHALENQEIYLVYQPQVSLTDEKVIAVEALARWNNPALGLISPQVFIPIAEHNGLINDIGEWILREACKQCKLWQDIGLAPVRIAVYVSVKQLINPEFVNTVMEVLEETELEPQYLELELTENIAIQESDYIISALSKLKVLGVSLAIDDFGMEYSSLSRIKLLPIDRLKIDMHFISGIQKSEKDRAIVDVIIRLAKDLKISVIAEGVEKEEQLQYLKSKLCDEVQGYYFYKPLSKEEIQRLLRDF
jgi:EAL domain-containing protein (putative c-di-GMP-specific phosphodiesterase class I)